MNNDLINSLGKWKVFRIASSVFCSHAIDKCFFLRSFCGPPYGGSFNLFFLHHPRPTISIFGLLSHPWRKASIQARPFILHTRGVDVNRRMVTSQLYSLLQEMRFGHIMTRYMPIFFLFNLCHSWVQVSNFLVSFLLLTTNNTALYFTLHG